MPLNNPFLSKDESSSQPAPPSSSSSPSSASPQASPIVPKAEGVRYDLVDAVPFDRDTPFTLPADYVSPSPSQDPAGDDVVVPAPSTVTTTIPPIPELGDRPSAPSHSVEQEPSIPEGNPTLSTTVPPTTTRDDPAVTSATATTIIPSQENDPDHNNEGVPLGECLGKDQFLLREILWTGGEGLEGVERRIRIVTQNENGPCPLVALTNVLLLRGDLEISPPDRMVIHVDDLVALLGNHLILHPAPTSADSQDDGAADQSMALNLLPQLKMGLDVDPRFDSPTSFTPSEAISLFRAFQVPLLHGWCADPQDAETFRALTGETCAGYNWVVEMVARGDDAGQGQVVDGGIPSTEDPKRESPSQGKEEEGEEREAESRNESHAPDDPSFKEEKKGISTSDSPPVKEEEDNIALEDSSSKKAVVEDGGDQTKTNETSPADDPSKEDREQQKRTDLIMNAHLAQQFLEATASQLTYHGLTTLHEQVKEGCLGILFRNNHVRPGKGGEGEG